MTVGDSDGSGFEANHYAFFAALGSMSEADERWPITVAGLVTLRLIDKWEMAVHRRFAPLPAEVEAVRRAIDAAPAGALRDTLTSVVDAVEYTHGQGLSAVSARVLAYAGLLYEREAWALAADVYRTFLMLTTTASDMELAAHAWVRLGSALIMIGELGAAARAYETGRALAAQQENRYMERLAEQGIATIALCEGSLPLVERASGGGKRRSWGGPA